MQREIRGRRGHRSERDEGQGGLLTPLWLMLPMLMLLLLGLPQHVRGLEQDAPGDRLRAQVWLQRFPCKSPYQGDLILDLTAVV